MATREVIIPPGMELLYERYHYCPGIKVGNMLYIAGQVGRDAQLQVVTEVEAQFVQAFENVKKVLTTAGASFDDVIELITYHVTGPAAGVEQLTIPYLPLFMEVKDRYFVNSYPTWTGIGVTGLSTPGLLVEIKCTAVLSA
jgi:enamine deaminase RidA (YjgF/YER057c/UK114 family)